MKTQENSNETRKLNRVRRRDVDSLVLSAFVNQTRQSVLKRAAWSSPQETNSFDA